MSAYLPPTQFLSIYNESEFVSMSSNLTTITADARYLKLIGGTEIGPVTFNSPINIADTTQSTTYSTGSIISAGGLGIAKDSYFNGNINLSGSGTSIHNRDGTVTNPAYSFANEQTSGLYRIGSNHFGYSIAGTKIVDYATTGLAITGSLSVTSNINPAAGSAANPSLYFASDTTNGFYRVSGGIGFSSGGSQLITFNNQGINNATKTFTENLAVGTGGNTIKLIQFGSQGFSITFTAGQLQGPYTITFPTTFSSTPRVMSSLVNGGGDPSQHVGYQITSISTSQFQVSFSNESSLSISANTYQIDWLALN